jgi:hypothetical protein
MRSRLLRALFIILAIAAIPQAASAKQKKSKERPQLRDQSAPVITHTRITKAAVGLPIIIRAKIEDESEIFAPSVYVRAQGKQDYETLAMRRVGEGYEATIAPEMTRGNLEYFIEAFDDQGNGPAREGSPEEPLRIILFDPAKGDPMVKKDSSATPVASVIPKDEGIGESHHALATQSPVGSDDDDGVAGKWWFWTLIGVALTGGVVTAVIFAQANGRPDHVDVMVRGPNPAAGVQ